MREGSVPGEGRNAECAELFLEHFNFEKVELLGGRVSGSPLAGSFERPSAIYFYRQFQSEIALVKTRKPALFAKDVYFYSTRRSKKGRFG